MMKSSMNQIETNDVNDDTEVGRVERSSSRQSPGHVFPGQGPTRQAPLAPGLPLPPRVRLLRNEGR